MYRTLRSLLEDPTFPGGRETGRTDTPTKERRWKGLLPGGLDAKRGKGSIDDD